MTKEKIEVVSSKKTPEKAPEPSKGDPTPLKELEEKNKQLFERAKKAEDKLKKISPKPKEKSEESKPPIKEDEWRNKIDFLLENASKKYSADEFDHIALVAKEKGISLNRAAKQEKDYITFNREKVAKEKKIPESGNVQSEKPIKGLDPKDMDEDSDAHRRIFEESIKSGKLTEPGV